jgi:hypothetical protein
MNHVLIGTARTKQLLNLGEMLTVEELPFLRVVDLEHPEIFHLLRRLDAIGRRGHDRRQCGLEMVTNRNQSAMRVVHVGLGHRGERIQIGLDELELILIDVLIVFQHSLDEVPVLNSWQFLVIVVR